MKDPCMLFYTSDFLTGTALMTMKERGQYITLLCLQQQRGHMTLAEMKKAVGALSEEVLSKYVQDDDGKYYNKRAEQEIERRQQHSKKQSLNAQKRYQKNNDLGQRWQETGNAVALPLETETEIEIETLNDIDLNVIQPIARVGGYGNGLARVMTYFLDKINPTPSSSCVDELKHYTAELSADVVLHAFGRAQDEGKTGWSYIRAILQNYSQKKLHTVTAVIADEKAHQAKKAGKAAPVASPSLSAEDARKKAAADFARLQKLQERVSDG